MFRKAERKASRLRMTIDGPAGSGKTYTALRFAMALAGPQGKVAYIDTERGSASKYVGEAPDEVPFVFDVLELVSFSPDRYIEAIQAAGRMGYAVLVIDSLSHAWEGKDGALEIKDRSGGSDWKAWRNVTPLHNRMVDAILQAPMHVITTMRSRMEYVQESDERGRVTVRRVGMSPVQRPGMEYEFDIVCDMDWAHVLTVSKSRCSAVADMKVERPGAAWLAPIVEWLQGGGVEATDGRQAGRMTAQETTEVVTTSAAPAPITLAMLIEQFGAEAVLAAADGQLPVEPADVARLADKLAFLASLDMLHDAETNGAGVPAVQGAPAAQGVPAVQGAA